MLESGVAVPSSQASDGTAGTGGLPSSSGLLLCHQEFLWLRIEAVDFLLSTPDVLLSDCPRLLGLLNESFNDGATPVSGLTKSAENAGSEGTDGIMSRWPPKTDCLLSGLGVGVAGGTVDLLRFRLLINALPSDKRLLFRFST